MLSPLLGDSGLFAREPQIPAWISESELAQAPAIKLPPVVIPVKPTKQVQLDIVLRKQIYSLSCESASLQMALEYFGIKKTQDQLLEQIGISEPYKSYTDENGTMIWGDPELGFVGNVRGFFSTKTDGMRGATGWGVNKSPIAKVAQQYRPDSQAYSGFTTNDVIKELDRNYPIIFWYVPDSYSTQSITYKTPAGGSVRFFRNHVALISGYTIINGETSFTVSDPLYGEYSVKKATLDRRMAKYEGDVVVVR